MKLLIITQKVDKNDDILGFFHGWLLEFAKNVEQVTVICLQKGEYDLPENVKVLSLGKEVRESRMKYLLSFYRYIFNERKNYDTVFVHMNSEYVVLGGLFWKLWNKKISLWHNHKIGNIFTRIAIKLADNVFHTSPLSFSASYKKAQIMPVGIDTKTFFRDKTIQKENNSILFLGRISPVKNVDIFIESLKLLDKKHIDFVANIYGDSIERDKDYYKKIRNTAQPLEKKGKIIFHKAVSNYKTPEIYNKNKIYVNLTESGSFDKTILEAMACETTAIYSNLSLKDKTPSILMVKQGDSADLAEKMEFLLNKHDTILEQFGTSSRDYVVAEHTLSLLIKKLINEINS